MANSFAITADYEDRYGALSPTDIPRVNILLEDASDYIRDLAPGIDARIETGTLNPRTPQRIVCRMVNDVMDADAGPSLTSEQQSAGPFSRTLNFANATGDMFLKANEKRALGIGRQRMGSFDPSAAL